MSVDRIGGGGPPIPGATEVSGTAPVDGPGAAAAADPVSAATPLEQLGRGEITLDGYLDARVNEAVQHLEARLPSSDLDFVRRSLRAELATDPVLTELVRQATGAVPSLPDE